MTAPSPLQSVEEPPPYCCYNASVPVLAVCVDLDDVLLPPPKGQHISELALMEWMHSFYVKVDSLLAEFPDLWRFATMHCTFSLAPLLPMPSENKADVLAAFAQRLLFTCSQVICLHFGSNVASA